MSEIKPEAIITFLGFKPEEIKTEEDFKTNFTKKFGIKDDLLNDKDFVGKIFGKRVGSIESAVKSQAKKMGIDFTKEEIEGKPVEDIVELSFNKIAELNKNAMDKFEKESKGTVDEQVKTWKEKQKATEDKLKDTEGLLAKTTQDFEGYKKDTVTKYKQDNINNYKKSVLGKLEFKQDITPVERVGFEAVLGEKYDFDLDENNAPYIKDKKSGQRIPSKKVIGQFMNAEEILQEELIANKLAILNHSGGQKVFQQKGSIPDLKDKEVKSVQFGDLFMTARVAQK
jgi:hypothetical protein